MLESTLPRSARNPMNGPTMKMATKNTAAKLIEATIWPRVSLSLSSTDWFDEIVSAFTPIETAWPRARTPRMPGLARNGNRRATERISCASRWMLRSGRRTAIAQWSRPRIITPSRTAWPP